MPVLHEPCIYLPARGGCAPKRHDSVEVAGHAHQQLWGIYLATCDERKRVDLPYLVYDANPAVIKDLNGAVSCLMGRVDHRITGDAYIVFASREARNEAYRDLMQALLAPEAARDNWLSARLTANREVFNMQGRFYKALLTY